MSSIQATLPEVALQETPQGANLHSKRLEHRDYKTNISPAPQAAHMQSFSNAKTGGNAVLKSLYMEVWNILSPAFTKCILAQFAETSFEQFVKLQAF